MAQPRKRLGKGLEALLSSTTSSPLEEQLASGSAVAIEQVEVSAIRPNPFQPRVDFDEAGIAELAESIRSQGMVQPVLLRREAGGYQLIAGERRWRAAQLAGLERVPAIIRQADDEQVMELALVENIHRQDLNPIERARAYQMYMTQFGLTQAAAAERLGEDRSNLANYIRLLDLPAELQQMVASGELTMGHARALLAVMDEELQRRLAARAATGRLSVRELERLVSRLKKAERPIRIPPARNPDIVEMETQLSRKLGRKVQILPGRKKHTGRIVIEYYSLDDFDRFLEQLLGPGRGGSTAD